MRPLPLVLLLAAFACNNGKDGTDTDTDTTATDDTDPSGSDDTDVEASPVVTVTVYDRTTGAPDANEIVLFLDADGALVDEVETNEEGKAEAEVEDGSTVVFMQHWDDDDQLPYNPTVFVDVGPGDNLVIGWPTQTTTPLEIRFPDFEGADQYYWVGASCGPWYSWSAYGSSGWEADLADCTTASVIAAARSEGATVAILAAFGVGTDEPIGLEAPWNTPTDTEIAATGLPSTAEGVSLELWTAAGNARVPGSMGGETAVSAGRAQISGKTPQVPGATAYLWVKPSRAGYITPVITARAPLSTDVTVDVADLVQPWLTIPEVDPAKRTVSWTSDGDGQIDAVVGFVGLRRGDDTVYWTFATPYDGTELTLPELPEPWSDYNLQAGDETSFDLAFLTGEGLAERARVDASHLADVALGATDQEIADTYAMTFSRTFFPD